MRFTLVLLWAWRSSSLGGGKDTGGFSGPEKNEGSPYEFMGASYDHVQLYPGVRPICCGRRKSDNFAFYRQTYRWHDYNKQGLAEGRGGVSRNVVVCILRTIS